MIHRPEALRESTWHLGGETLHLSEDDSERLRAHWDREYEAWIEEWEAAGRPEPDDQVYEQKWAELVEGRPRKHADGYTEDSPWRELAPEDPLVLLNDWWEEQIGRKEAERRAVRAFLAERRKRGGPVLVPMMVETRAATSSPRPRSPRRRRRTARSRAGPDDSSEPPGGGDEPPPLTPDQISAARSVLLGALRRLRLEAGR